MPGIPSPSVRVQRGAVRANGECKRALQCETRAPARTAGGLQGRQHVLRDGAGQIHTEVVAACSRPRGTTRGPRPPGRGASTGAGARASARSLTALDRGEHHGAGRGGGELRGLGEGGGGGQKARRRSSELVGARWWQWKACKPCVRVCGVGVERRWVGTRRQARAHTAMACCASLITAASREEDSFSTAASMMGPFCRNRALTTSKPAAAWAPSKTGTGHVQSNTAKHSAQPHRQNEASPALVR
jgi:hypothetical protein